jgi:hypothetical protein
MNALVNIGLVLQRIREKNCAGFGDAAALCRTSPNNFKKLAKGNFQDLTYSSGFAAALVSPSKS